MLSTCGELEIKRVYRRCSSCTETIHPTDDLLGLKDGYTVGLRDMAVFAGIESGGFAKAQKRLQKLSGDLPSRHSASPSNGPLRVAALVF